MTRKGWDFPHDQEGVGLSRKVFKFLLLPSSSTVFRVTYNTPRVCCLLPCWHGVLFLHVLWWSANQSGNLIIPGLLVTLTSPLREWWLKKYTLGWEQLRPISSLQVAPLTTQVSPTAWAVTPLWTGHHLALPSHGPGSLYTLMILIFLLPFLFSPSLPDQSGIGLIKAL